MSDYHTKPTAPHLRAVPPLDGHEEHAGIRRVRFIANLMDTAITLPFLKKRIGLDPILGLCPVVGDVVTGVVACYTLWVAYDLKLPVWVLVRMSANVLIDTTVGNVPVMGDLFDWFWKANTKNLRILEEEYARIKIQRLRTVVPFPTDAAFTHHVPASAQLIDVEVQHRQ